MPTQNLPEGCWAQVEFSEARIAAMQEDRRILLEDATAHRNVLLQRLDASGERLADMETALQETAKSLILGMFPADSALPSTTEWHSTPQMAAIEM